MNKIKIKFSIIALILGGLLIYAMVTFEPSNLGELFFWVYLSIMAILGYVHLLIVFERTIKSQKNRGSSK